MEYTSYGDEGFSKFVSAAFRRHLGHDDDDFKKPIVGICNTSSEVNRCHSHYGPIIEAIKRGVIMQGGIPLEFPTISIGEMTTSPTTMLYRNLVAMDTEEMITAQPIDGVVLLGGCDKMLPGQLMGASSANKPAITFTRGPMANGEYEGDTLGACTDCRFYWQEHRSGAIDKKELNTINVELAPTPGHCMVMGSASTISVCTEALGMMYPGASAIPATVNERLHKAQKTGEVIVNLVKKNLRPSDIMTKKSFENAIRVLMSVGGSTNTVIHLIAIARRLGITLTLDMFDEISKNTPFIANLRPAGDYQMQDFYHAGGVPSLMKVISPLLYKNEITVTGKKVKDNIENIILSKKYEHIIKPLENPIYPSGGIKVLKGNLVPGGAVIKPKAATKKLLKHSGRAVVFHSIEDMERRIDDHNLNVTKDSVLILKNAGPVGAPGMPEAGMIPIPKKLLETGVRDMVRISDCRMSGTAFGTIVLHASPESAVGGPIAFVKDDDKIELDVEKGKLILHVNEKEIKKRKKEMEIKNINNNSTRGYKRLYRKHVLQAHEGCDFDFM